MSPFKLKGGSHGLVYIIGFVPLSQERHLGGAGWGELLLGVENHR